MKAKPYIKYFFGNSLEEIYRELQDYVNPNYYSNRCYQCGNAPCDGWIIVSMTSIRGVEGGIELIACFKHN